jgi:hypothetical protein
MSYIKYLLYIKMVSPRCTLNRWGNTDSSGGNSCYTPKTATVKTATVTAKEMEDKFKKMMAEREKTDNIWTSPTTNSSSTKTDK